MSKKHLVVVLLFALALLGGVCTGIFVSSGEEQMAETSAAEEDTKAVEEEEFVEAEPASEPVLAEKYMVTVSDNRLFIYKIASDNSLEIVEDKEIDANDLRHEDYEALFRGITVDTLTKAREIAEDYVS